MQLSSGTRIALRDWEGQPIIGEAIDDPTRTEMGWLVRYGSDGQTPIVAKSPTGVIYTLVQTATRMWDDVIKMKSRNDISARRREEVKTPHQEVKHRVEEETNSKKMITIDETKNEERTIQEVDEQLKEQLKNEMVAPELVKHRSALKQASKAEKESRVLASDAKPKPVKRQKA